MKAKAILILVIALLVLQAVFVGTAMAVTYNEVAGEFMCQCGCNLVLKDCETMPCAIKDNLKQVINGMIKNGQTKEEIVKTMRVSYKDQILSAPPREGFNWMAWLTPFVLVIAGGIAIQQVVSLWARRQRERYAVVGVPGASSKAVPKKYADKLSKELDEFGGF